MTTAYLLLGTNIGDRATNLLKARTLLARDIGIITAESSILETAAWGKTDQADFLNQAITIDTPHSPLALLQKLKSIEIEMGRVDTTQWGPRLIDIDILLYGKEIVNEPSLKIPHPYLHVRQFALLPLAELAKDIVHPVLNKTIEELLVEFGK